MKTQTCLCNEDPPFLSLLLFFTLAHPQPVCGNAELRSLMDMKASLNPDVRSLKEKEKGETKKKKKKKEKGAKTTSF
ncbi:hypothetical protein HYC85_021959 [Camellia sinensis]|uniref:Uncharacterized protein n=1 Tax=Camellia sinensis TaxID=4442 RepID=A0A7J7GIZ2_CAMSI|nr:hypothetical protein HYC85_021959 [Camellia sinensis]